MAKAKRSSRHSGQQQAPVPKQTFDSPFKQLKKLYTGKLEERAAACLQGGQDPRGGAGSSRST